MKYLISVTLYFVCFLSLGQEYVLLNEYNFFDIVDLHNFQDQNQDDFVEFSSLYLGSGTYFRPSLLFAADGALFLNSIDKSYIYKIDKRNWSITRSNMFLASYGKTKYLDINGNFLFWDRKRIYAYNDFDDIFDDDILRILKSRKRYGNFIFSYEDTPSMILDNNFIFFYSSSKYNVRNILVVNLNVSNDDVVSSEFYQDDEAYDFLASKYPDINFANGYQLSNTHIFYEPEYLFDKHHKSWWDESILNTSSKSILLNYNANNIYIQSYDCIFKIDLKQNISAVISLSPILDQFNADFEYPENDYYLCAVDDEGIYLMHLSPSNNKIFLYEVKI